jgi:hypothetical protein
MITDSLMMLSDAQAFTADAVTTNTIDLGNVTPKRGIGTGEPMAIVITVDVAADHTTGDETYEFQFIQSANADLSSPDILCLRTILYSDLTAGSIHVIPVPPGSITKRYIGVNYNGGGTTPTITATIFLQPMSMIQQNKDYAKGYTIS